MRGCNNSEILSTEMFKDIHPKEGSRIYDQTIGNWVWEDRLELILDGKLQAVRIRFEGLIISGILTIVTERGLTSERWFMNQNPA